MHRYAIVIVVLWVCLCAGLAAAQTGIVEPVPYVYRMKIDDCKFEPVARRQTGFRVEGVVGIVTALHGVADCETISAVSDDGIIFTDLVIVAVDIDRDMARLTSPSVEELPADGLIPSSLSTTEILKATLRIVGYPRGLERQDIDAIESIRDVESLDDVIPDAEEPADFIKRKSPSLAIEVLNIQAQMLPGHSGAPLIDSADQLVAIGNGGLRGGADGRSWAIPWQAIEWESVAIATVERKLAELAVKDIAALSFSSTYPSQVDNDEVSDLATYTVQVVDATGKSIAHAEVLLTHSAGYEIGVTDSEGFYTFHLSTDVSYIQSQIQVEAPGYPLYSRTLSNVTNKVGTEIVRLKSILTATPSVSSTKPTLCGFEFLVLDEETEYPIDHAYVTVILAGARKSGYTLKDGSFAASLPCNEEYPKAEVRVSASTYQLNSQRITLVGQIETVYLAHLATPIATLTITPTPTATSTPSIHPVSPQLKPTATPTATPTAIPTPKPFYFTIPITAVANNSTNEGYIEPPSGNITLGGIPFFLPDGQNSVTTQVEALQSNPTVIRLPNLNIKSPSSVHLLITGGYTKVAFRDKKVGEIRLIFSDNQSHSIDLIPGINLREWKNYGDYNVTTISDPNVTQAWAGNNKFDSSMAIIDMLTINIPANQQNNVLAAIEIYDTSAQTVGDLDPALNLIGVTVLGIQ